MKDTTQYSSAVAGLNAQVRKIYSYVAMALFISGAVSYYISHNTAMMQALFGTGLKWIVIFAPLAIAMFMGFAFNSLSSGAMFLMLILYSATIGASISTIFLIYTAASIFKAFLMAGVVFLGASLYGFTTKRNLLSMGSFLMVALIALILLSLVNLFIKSTGMDIVLSIATIVLFTGLIAYDSQAIEASYIQAKNNEELLAKFAVFHALSLFINFIQIFLALLRLFGDRRS